MTTLLPGAEAPLRLTLVHGRRDRTLAHDLLNWSRENGTASVPAQLELIEADGDDAVTAARQLADAHRLALFIDSEGRRDGVGPVALRINQRWQQQRHPGLFLLCSERGHELLAVRHPGHSACLQCWHTQLQNFPWLQDDHGTVASNALAGALAAALHQTLTSPQDLEGHCLRLDASGTARRLRLLRDPICPHCTDWSHRPTQAFYVQSTEAA